MEILCIDKIFNALLVTEKYKTQNLTMVPMYHLQREESHHLSLKFSAPFHNK